VVVGKGAVGWRQGDDNKYRIADERAWVRVLGVSSRIGSGGAAKGFKNRAVPSDDAMALGGLQKGDGVFRD